MEGAPRKGKRGIAGGSQTTHSVPIPRPRHTAASLRLAQGDHPKVVQELLGHARISITFDPYSHVMPSLQSESAEKMDRTLAKMVRGS